MNARAGLVDSNPDICADMADKWLNSYVGEQKKILDWVIIGVESNGPRVGRLSLDGKATEADWLGWAVSIVEQCHAAGVAVFVKQVPVGGRLVHDVEQFPEALRYQEFPR
jgi:protein gp37